MTSWSLNCSSTSFHSGVAGSSGRTEVVLSAPNFTAFGVAMYSTVSPILFDCFVYLLSRKTFVLVHIEVLQSLFGGGQKEGIHTVNQEYERS